MKIYVAGPWITRADSKAFAQQLRDKGHTVTSRWHDMDGDSTDPNVLRTEAVNDLHDILSSEMMIVLNTSKSEGKAFEQGVAFWRGLPILIVGQPSNVFHYMPHFTFVSDIAAALNVLH